MTRVLIFSFTGFLLLTLIGPIQRFLGLDVVVLDVPLITVLYLAMASGGTAFSRVAPRSSLFSGRINWPGALTGVILGYLCDIMGGGIKGIHCLTMAIMFMLCLWAVRHVYLVRNLSVIVVTFAASVVASLLGLIIRWLTGTPLSLASLKIVVAQAVLCAAAAPLLMRLFRMIDVRLSGDSSERGSLSQ